MSNKFALISAVNYSVDNVLQGLFSFIYCGYRVCMNVNMHVVVRRQLFRMSWFLLSILFFRQVLSCYQLLCIMFKLLAKSPVYSCHVMVRVQGAGITGVSSPLPGLPASSLSSKTGEAHQSSR